MSFMCVGPLAALWNADMQSVSVAGVRVLLVRHDDRVQAFEDRCAHLGQPLSEGRLESGVITCAAHGWCYDARSGLGVNPRSARLRVFPVEVRNGEIWLDTEQGSLAQEPRP